MTRARTPALRAESIDQQHSERLFSRWRHHGDRRAREELIRRFMPLARRLAARYRAPDQTFEDLAQVAMVGLIEAVDRFDPDGGAPFLSFALTS